ncbi:TPA: hypothetical protein ACH3X3_004948 [Trebouxia sp. C0006]
MPPGMIPMQPQAFAPLQPLPADPNLTNVNPNQSIMHDPSQPSQAPVQQHPSSLQPFPTVPANPNMTISTQVLQSGPPCNNQLGFCLDPKGLLQPKSPASILRINHLIPHTAPVICSRPSLVASSSSAAAAKSGLSGVIGHAAAQTRLSQSMKRQTWCIAFLMT